ncbi:phosphoadenylyl-sulfate reductase [Brachybacterium sacelli]|uniref:Adenosine 5'-phosphosulfate reductase n=1 Tax=Brachybacterium sacelli TaxID=173364 RepID=A0ABS4X613_9MICO|nr:phosphoadenylyl-sulfate reductase [Brachybacterium sacelli]MBP2383902.1 phosphoadenosine phosphosulfate reductase [Brachybacterium sacelli]
MSASTERTARLRALVAEAAPRFAALEDELGPDQVTEAVSAWAAEVFGSSLAVACSMADAVLPHVVSRHRPGVDVLFLETGYHFPETLATRDRVAAELDVHVVDVLPERTVAEQDADHGARLHDRDPSTCCALRKVEPLRRSLSGYDAWVTGVRREEGPTRADTPLVTYDEAFDLVKINPLVSWSFGQVMGYSHDHGLPENPLLQQGFPSIGCAPCTRAVAPGEDPRAGRWSGSAKTECGLHPADDSAAQEPSSPPTVAPLSLLTVDPAQEER